MHRQYETAEERQAYYDGREDGGNEAKGRPYSFVVVFEDHVGSDERKAIAALIGHVRGVVAVLPVTETHHGHLQWRELVEALGCDPSEEYAQETATKCAATASTDAEKAALAWDAFFKMATPEQRATILSDIYPRLGKV